MVLPDLSIRKKSSTTIAKSNIKGRIFAVLRMIALVSFVHAEDVEELLVASAQELKDLKTKKTI